jgi:hypothetical protein
MRLIWGNNIFIIKKKKVMSVGNWIKKGAVRFALATAGVEKNTLSQASEITGAGTGSVRPVNQNQLMRDLKEGRVTQEVEQFRRHHYQVLQASEKYKARWGKDGDFKMMTEEEVRQSKVAQGDPYDTYKVEVSIDNTSQSTGLLSEEVVRPIKVDRTIDSGVKLEDVSHLINVRDINGTNKLVEFYITDSPENRRAVLEARHLMTNPGITEFNNITNFSFVAGGHAMLQYEYRILAFDKVVNYNGSYIVKMFAECTNNGTWLAQKYMLD